MSPARAQENPVEKQVTNTWNQYRSRYIQDKLFVHTDKNSYVSREILWFRVYYRDVFFNKPGSVSKIAYIELLDKNHLPVLQTKVSLKPGESDGSFIIPVNIPSGTYTFRAYTNWMKNSGAESFFEKPIRILNPLNLQKDSAVVLRDRYDIQFFPEGGDLVQQLESCVAFRVTDAGGQGMDFTGKLVNAKGDTVLAFHPLHFGLGSFTFTPAPNQTYTAWIQFPNGRQTSKELPAAPPYGMVMQLKTAGDQVSVMLQGSPDLEGQDVYVWVHGGHSAMPVEKRQLSGGRASFNFNTATLEDGISQCTVFNKNGQPVCERLFFKYPSATVSISGDILPEYAIRKKIGFEVSVTDSAGKPEDADMSLAVYRLDSLQTVDETDIRNDFYLTGELGPVQSPSFYFDAQNKTKDEDMNNLMLTQGWRRFRWKEMVKNQTGTPEFTPEYDGHLIRGRLVSAKTGEPLPNEDVYLSVPSKRTQFRPSASDKQGRLKFELRDFYGSDEMIVQTNTLKDTLSQMEISSPFSNTYSSYTPPFYTVPDRTSSTLLDQTIHEQVQHIYTGNRLNRFNVQPVDTNFFYVVPDEKYLLDDYVRFITMEEVLREYVQSLNVVRRGENFQLYLIDKPRRQFFETPPLILIDGVPFFDANELFQQDPKKIKRIDLINRQYALGDQTYDGIVNVTTYNGDLNGIQMNPHATVLDYPGIPERREFFSPEYETESQIGSRMPDFRTLLYWNPQIRAGSVGKKEIHFYSSDLPGNYVAVFQGITETGIPVSRVIYFSVKK